MYGNAEEWCWNWYEAFTSADQTDPTGPSSGDFRMRRGGNWSMPMVHQRSSFQGHGKPPYYYCNVGGFRVAHSF
jgi:formylglycine-generating enzyme required for sulfatase activity